MITETSLSKAIKKTSRWNLKLRLLQKERNSSRSQVSNRTNQCFKLRVRNHSHQKKSDKRISRQENHNLSYNWNRYCKLSSEHRLSKPWQRKTSQIRRCKLSSLAILANIVDRSLVHLYYRLIDRSLSRTRSSILSHPFKRKVIHSYMKATQRKVLTIKEHLNILETLADSKTGLKTIKQKLYSTQALCPTKSTERIPNLSNTGKCGTTSLTSSRQAWTTVYSSLKSTRKVSNVRSNTVGQTIVHHCLISTRTLRWRRSKDKKLRLNRGNSPYQSQWTQMSLK